MAIDTQDKRASAIRMCMSVADGTIDDGDRVQSTWNYRGISIAEAIETFPGDSDWTDASLGDTSWTNASLGDTSWTDRVS